VWLGWLVVTAGVFSFMAGIYHDYYTVALAPAIGGAVALGGAALWANRGRLTTRLLLAATSAGTGLWAFVLLQQAGSWYTVLGWTVFAVGVGGGIAMVWIDRFPRMLATVTLTAAIAAGLAGPYAYSVNTAATAHTGSIVTAGPVTSFGRGGGGRGGAGGQPPTGTGAPTRTGTTTGDGRTTGADGAGGLLNGANTSTELVNLLSQDAAGYTWVAAAVGSQNAASYQLATGDAVMAIGGFNGSDPSPTLEEFKADVAAGRIHYFLGGTLGGRQNGGSSSATEIATWVSQTYTATTVGGTTVYDLTRG
jgi:hypothetical protein